MSATIQAKHSLAILDDYQSASQTFADWTPLAGLATTVFTSAIAPDELVATLKPFTIIHAMRERTKFPQSLLEQLPNLRFISTTGVHNRGIDLIAARARSIPISGTTASTGVSSGSSGTVEQTWALILALGRLLVPSHESTTSPLGWQIGVAPGLAGKTLGLVGLGRLGSAVAVVGKAFGMNVVAWSPNLTEERADAARVGRCASLEGLMRGSDVVSLHLVLAPSTEGMIGRRELGWMKESAFLINTSRGPLVDETALREVLDAGGIAGAGLDVFAEEPLPVNDPWRTTKNVVLSPHMGYVDEANYRSWWPQTVENIVKFLEGEPVRLLN